MQKHHARLRWHGGGLQADAKSMGVYLPAGRLRCNYQTVSKSGGVQKPGQELKSHKARSDMSPGRFSSSVTFLQSTERLEPILLGG